MSLTSSLNFAVAGLDLTSRRAEVVARNVAGADRAGYAMRTVGGGGPGVGLPGSQVAIVRESDPRLVQLRREAQSREAGASIAQTFHTRLEEGVGDPDEAGSLQDSLARLDAAFVSAAANPSSEIRLTEISHAAADLAGKLNTLDEIVQEGRQKADADIGQAADQINSDLKTVARLNTDIARLNVGGHDAADLLDQRGVLIDRISAQIPIRELVRDNGGIALVTRGGVMLLDGKPAELGFDPRAPITPEMSAPIQLSGLTVNGKSIPTSGSTNGIVGGGMSALFELRDEVAPDATSRLDSLAAVLIGRFGGVAVDPTLAADEPGLFTDRGAAFDANALPGLAGRIAINGAVAPDQVDQHWRLRDGLGAAASGDAGNGTLLLGYGRQLATDALPILNGLPEVSTGVAGHFANLRSLVSSDRVRADDTVTYAAAEAQNRAEQRDGGAVDIDGEMRRLVEIEQAYAANARVVQAVDEMMNRLTEL